MNDPADPVRTGLASRWLGAGSTRCSSLASLRTSPGAPSPFEGAPLGRACDYNRLSGFTHLRASALPSPYGVLKPPNLLCEAFGHRNRDSPAVTSSGSRCRGRMTASRTVTKG